VSGEGVQQALLKMVEGTRCRVTVDGKKKHPNTDTVEIDTTNILFIGGGAFDGMDAIVSSRKNGSGIGFNTRLGATKETNDVLPEDLIKFGMIPEFVGRFPVTVTLEELGLAELAQTLIEPKNSLLAQMQFFFESDGLILDFEDSALLAVAQAALDLGIGARGLKTVLEKALNPLMFEIPELKRNGIKRIIVTEDMITNKARPILEEHEKLPK
jgi:ATP-dependent Clp protease ATP-binding subunit ClpX